MILPSSAIRTAYQGVPDGPASRTSTTCIGRAVSECTGLNSNERFPYVRHLDGVVHGAGDELQVVGARQEADAEQVGLVPRVHHDGRPRRLRVVPYPDLLGCAIA